jgi:hypothetical protein
MGSPRVLYVLLCLMHHPWILLSLDCHNGSLGYSGPDLTLDLTFNWTFLKQITQSPSWKKLTIPNLDCHGLLDCSGLAAKSIIVNYGMFLVYLPRAWRVAPMVLWNLLGT